MSDWGKLLSWVFEMLNTKSWIVATIAAAFLYLPESWLPASVIEARKNWDSVAFLLLGLALLFVINSVCRWIWEKLCRVFSQKSELKKFNALHPSRQMLLLDLYFGGMGSFLFWINSEAVVELVNDGYITYGMIDFDDKNNAVAELWLTESALELIRRNKSEMQKKRASLAGQGERANVQSWIWARR